MDSIAAIAVSGMNAARQRMSVAAHNIANMPTEGFQRQAVQAQSVDGGGVRTTVVRAGAGDWVEDLVQLKFASYQFRANAISLQRSSDMLGSLLDMKA